MSPRCSRPSLVSCRWRPISWPSSPARGCSASSGPSSTTAGPSSVTTNDKQVIFSLIGVGRVHKPNKQVLKDIYLSFFYGAKIGVLGLNGAGKSTLLRIIAGIDKDYIGQVTSQKGITFGYLSQEPELDPKKTVKEVVE